MIGELGSGKTCLVRGLGRGLGIREQVASPTFILMRQHRGEPGLCHADAYRLSSPEEFEDLGLEDILHHSVLAVEWAERVMDALPQERVEVALAYDGECRRRIIVAARGGRLAQAVKEGLS